MAGSHTVCELCFSQRIPEEIVPVDGHVFCTEEHARRYFELHPEDRVVKSAPSVVKEAPKAANVVNSAPSVVKRRPGRPRKA